MNKALLKWSPAVAIRKPDNIISSTAKNHAIFTPSYENDPKENMTFLMSNEYMRIWFKEKAVHEKNTYTKEEIIKEESKIKRRIIQRMMTYRKPTKNQFIDNLARERVKGNKVTEIRGKGHEKMKFKPQCLDKTHSEVKVKSKSEIHHQGLNGHHETSKVNVHHEDSDDEDCDADNKCEVILSPVDCDCEQTNVLN